jgi:hypothetical protein
MKTQNITQEYIPTFLEKMGWRLFPSRYVECHFPGNVNLDELRITVISHLSIFDRIRVLISGRVVTCTHVATENVIGRHQSQSVVYVIPPKILSRSEEI